MDYCMPQQTRGFFVNTACEVGVPGAMILYYVYDLESSDKRRNKDGVEIDMVEAQQYEFMFIDAEPFFATIAELATNGYLAVKTREESFALYHVTEKAIATFTGTEE